VTASTTSRLCISAHACGGKKRLKQSRKEKERTRSRTVKITNDVGHAGLVAEGSSKMHGLLRVILTAPQALRCSVYGPHCGRTIGRTLGKDLTFPRWRDARFRGKKPSEPCRGASYCRSPSRCVEKKSGFEPQIAAGEGRVERVTRKKINFRQCRSNVRLAKGEERQAGRRFIPYGDCEPESATDKQGNKGRLMTVMGERIPHCVRRLPTVLRFLEVEEE
jgi:hypothetical protein